MQAIPYGTDAKSCFYVRFNNIRYLLSEVLLKIDVSLKGEIDVKMRDNLEYATKCSGK